MKSHRKKEELEVHMWSSWVFCSLLFPWFHCSFSAFKLVGEGSESWIEWVRVD